MTRQEVPPLLTLSEVVLEAQWDRVGHITLSDHCRRPVGREKKKKPRCLILGHEPYRRDTGTPDRPRPYSGDIPGPDCTSAVHSDQVSSPRGSPGGWHGRNTYWNDLIRYIGGRLAASFTAIQVITSSRIFTAKNRCCVAAWCPAPLVPISATHPHSCDVGALPRRWVGPRAAVSPIPRASSRRGRHGSGLAAPRRRVRGAVGGGAPAPHARCVVAPETNRRAGRLAALDGPAWRLPCARPRHPNGHRHRGAVRKSVYGRPPAATQPAARSRPRQERRCGVRGAPPRHFAPRARRRSSVAHVPTSPRRAARCPTATARRPATATRAPSRRCHCHRPDTLPQTWTTAQSVLDARLGPLAAPPTRPAARRPRGRAAGSRFWSTESQQASTAPECWWASLHTCQSEQMKSACAP